MNLNKYIDRAAGLRFSEGLNSSPALDGFLSRLYKEGRREETQAWGWSPEACEQFLGMQFRAREASYKMQFPDGVNGILEQDGATVGRLFVDESATAIRLVDIELLPEYQNRGIGSSILAAIANLADYQAKPAELSVRQGNRAVALYQRHGFVETNRDEVYIAMKREAKS